MNTTKQHRRIGKLSEAVAKRIFADFMTRINCDEEKAARRGRFGYSASLDRAMDSERFHVLYRRSEMIAWLSGNGHHWQVAAIAQDLSYELDDARNRFTWAAETIGDVFRGVKWLLKYDNRRSR